MNGHENILYNSCFWTAVLSWTLAQTIKMITRIVTRHEFDFGVFASTGGMPSAHTAMVVGLATAVGLRQGFDSAIFALAVIFASVVMFDAQSVRRAAGQQARLLNQIVQELFKDHHLSQEKLAELLGHTRLEVFVGMITGILVALAFYARFPGPA
jgi:acid phosphatase family membrane protein YuiD